MNAFLCKELVSKKLVLVFPKRLVPWPKEHFATKDAARTLKQSAF